MTARLTAAGMLVVALMAMAPTAHATPFREPGTGAFRDARLASLLQELRLDYADTHQRGTHNEIALALNDPAAAFL